MASSRRGEAIIEDWWLEIIAVLTSIVLLGALSVILSLFVGKPIFDSGMVTLNVVVSTISTLEKALMTLAIASAISQWNWILFSDRPRRLYDFECVADASRGTLGSFRLLGSFHIRGGTIVRFGALVMVGTIAFDPFAQQLVQFNQETKFSYNSTGPATVPLAQRYSKGSGFHVSLPGLIDVEDGQLRTNQSQLAWADADFAFQSAVVFGTTAQAKAIAQQLAFQCPSSDCAFPRVSSLAVCSRCSDLGPYLQRNDNNTGNLFGTLDRTGDPPRPNKAAGNTEFRLPNGLCLSNIDTDNEAEDKFVYLTMFGTTDRNKTVTMGDIDTLIWSQSVIKMANNNTKKKWPADDVIATECALYYCVKAYDSTISNGTLRENSTVIEANRTADSWQIQDDDPNLKGLDEDIAQSIAFNIVRSRLNMSDLSLQSPDSDRRWKISQTAIDGVSFFVQKTFQVCMNENCTESIAKVEPINGFYMASRDQKQYEPSIAKVLYETDINSTFENIASSMSTAIRNGGDLDLTQSGKVGTLTTVYAVDWRWISLHCITELGAVVFLALTIWATSRGKGQMVPAWKASGLAALSKGVHLGDSLRDAGTTRELEERAKAMSVVLLGNEKQRPPEYEPEWGLVDRGGQNYTGDYAMAAQVPRTSTDCGEQCILGCEREGHAVGVHEYDPYQTWSDVHSEDMEETVEPQVNREF